MPYWEPLVCEPRWLCCSFPSLLGQRGSLCYTWGMDLAIIIGIGAFVILGIMFALLRVASDRDEREDTITQEIIVKANTGPVTVHVENNTQEEAS